MAGVLKKLRHPCVGDAAAFWKSISSSLNFADKSNIVDVPGLPSFKDFKATDARKEVAATALIREIAAMSAIRCFGKSLEAIDALNTCSDVGLSASSIVLSYNASYFSAKAFCLLLGFAPLGPDSKVLVDLFAEEENPNKKSKVPEDMIAFYSYSRWGHAEVWELAQRLIATVKKDPKIDHLIDGLKSAKIEDASKIRNKYTYNDALIYPIYNDELADFPDNVDPANLANGKFTGSIKCVGITEHFIEICKFVLQDSSLDEQLPNVACERRLQLLAA